MNNLWAKYQAWLKRREHRTLEDWKRKRAKGKNRYVLWVMFIWSGLMLVVLSLSDYFDGSFRIDRLVIKIPIYLLGGYVLGLFAWWLNERNYQTSLKANHDGKSHSQ